MKCLAYSITINCSKLIQFIAKTERKTVAMMSCGGSHWLARKCQEFWYKTLLIPPPPLRDII